MLLLVLSAAGLLLLGMLAKWLATWLGLDGGLAYLAVLVAASGLLSVALAVQRRQLRRKLQRMPEAERRALAAKNVDIRYAIPRPGARPVWLTVGAGVTLVNGPVLPLMIGPLYIMQEWFVLEPPGPQFLALGGGLLIAWLWWSVSVSLWRKWAEAGGMLPGEVQYHGERVNLLWPQGHFFERTEFHRWRKLVETGNRT